MHKRLQLSVTSPAESRLIAVLCRSMPDYVTPDHLSMAGLAGAALVFAGCALGNLDWRWLGLTTLGFLINWFGDSLDGSLARHRRAERPRYGYFVDHSVDALGNLLIAAGLGVTAAIRMDVALFALAGYLLLSISVFLQCHVMDEFPLSFLGVGPTEVRLILAVLTLATPWLGRIRFIVGGPFQSTAGDAIVFAFGLILDAIFVLHVLEVAGRLRRQAELP